MNDYDDTPLCEEADHVIREGIPHWHPCALDAGHDDEHECTCGRRWAA